VVDETLLEAQRRMHGAMEAFGRELRSIRTGRANISILDEVQVDYYGVPTPLNQLANLAAPEPQLLQLQPYDKTSVGAIERAILQADLGLNPSNDGSVIRVPIPELTEERRQEMARRVGVAAETAKTAVRQVRRDANDQLKRQQQDKEMSEDEEHRGHTQVQELTDKFCDEIEQLADNKRQELLTL